jgi:hypothetical protein
MPGDCENPWKQGLGGMVRVAGTMDTHPAFLQQILRITAPHMLVYEVAEEARRQALDKFFRVRRISSLIPDHVLTEFVLQRAPWRLAF